MTWTAPEMTREEPPRVADERAMLDAWLDFHRQTLLWKCAGLTAEQLVMRSAEPSGLSLEWRRTDVSLRWIYVHMIEEYARHIGHAGLLRERIDGATGV
jgi:hypothetical protein